MTFSPFLALLKIKSVKWTLIGLAIAFVGFPLISAAIPYVFPNAKARSGSYHDVVDMKEISLLAVQRLDFSKVCAVRHGTDSITKGLNVVRNWIGFDSSDTNSLENSKVYVRRIMRGHVTTSLDFSKIAVTNSPQGKILVLFPNLIREPFIDEWIKYDSKGTGDVNTKEMTSAMTQAFRDDMRKNALQPERVARAKKQAERIVDMLYPDMEYEFIWPSDKKDSSQSDSMEGKNE